ncbi:MAG: glycoside hydrolase, partial [Gammaproteobacteria bacterium]|nr:glycoside hydrolase [Gammaproteobacteria bacterium]
MSADQDNQDPNPLNVVLLWHMHQPEYRDLRNGVFHQPWTYLHIIKDYVDMAAHLEQVPAARAVVNFVPVLLEQIDDYSQQLDNYLHHGGAIRDPLLAALADPVVLHEPDHSLQLIKDCLRANEQRLINRFPAYQKLAMMAQYILQDPEILEYYDEQFITDLLVWYHLAWMGETVRRDNEQVKAL